MKHLKTGLLGLVIFALLVVASSNIQDWWTKKLDLIDTNTHYDHQFETINNMMAAHRFTSTEMRNLLLKIPSVSRARLAVIHGTKNATSIPLLKFDIINAISADGYVSGDLAVNLPLAQWNDYMDTLIAGKCAFVNIEKNLKDEASKLRASILNVKAIVACPMMNEKKQLLGALFVNWDSLDLVPNDLLPTMALVQEVADKFGKIYSTFK